MKDTAIIYFSQGWSLSLGNLSLEGGGNSLATTITVPTIYFYIQIGNKEAYSLLCWVRLQSDVLLLGTDRWEDHLCKRAMSSALIALFLHGHIFHVQVT